MPYVTVVKVTVGKDSVTLKLQGANKFFALKSSITIPIGKITKISTDKVKPLWLPHMRVGTHLPGVFMAGTFWVQGGKTFYFAKDFSRCITLHLKNHDYSKVIVQVDNKEAIAARISEAIGK